MSFVELKFADFRNNKQQGGGAPGHQFKENFTISHSSFNTILINFKANRIKWPITEH